MHVTFENINLTQTIHRTFGNKAIIDQLKNDLTRAFGYLKQKHDAVVQKTRELRQNVLKNADFMDDLTNLTAMIEYTTKLKSEKDNLLNSEDFNNKLHQLILYVAQERYFGTESSNWSRLFFVCV